MGNWYDNTGLYREYGTTKATVAAAGQYRTTGDFREINLRITDLTALTSSAVIQDNNLKFPTGTRIAKIEVITDTAATSGGSATLDIGLQKEDRSTEIDYNGLVAALPLTSIDAAGETTSLTAGSTYGGALLGTSTTDVGYLTANYNTAAFTAGAVNVRIFLYGRGTITQ